MKNIFILLITSILFENDCLACIRREFNDVDEGFFPTPRVPWCGWKKDDKYTYEIDNSSEQIDEESKSKKNNETINQLDCIWSKTERQLDCCNMGIIDPVFAQPSSYNKCATELKISNATGAVDFFNPCVQECIFEKEGLLIVNMPNFDKMIKMVNTNKFVSSKEKELVLKAVTFCKGSPSNLLEKMTGLCQYDAAIASHCIASYIYKNCPDWSYNKECRKTKNKLLKCFKKFLNPPNTISLLINKR